MRFVLLLVLALVTVGCGDDPLHPTYVPQTIYPYPPEPDGYCPVQNITGGWQLEPCP